MPRSLELILSDLLDEMRYILDTNDVEDSRRNGTAIRDEAARACGLENYDAFVEASEAR